MEKKLQRIEHGKVLGGVATGLAEYLDMDVTIVRIIFILLGVFGFSGVLIYIVLWIALPERTIFNFTTNSSGIEPQAFTAPGAEPFVGSSSKKKPGNGRIVGGLILVGMGSYFLLREFDFIPEWFRLHRLWPLIFIVMGLILLLKSGKKKHLETADYKRASSETEWDKKQPDSDVNSNTTPL